MRSIDKVWLVVLNWRNGKDTVDCLQSAYSVARDELAGIVLCDNASGDDSIERVTQWAVSNNVTLQSLAWDNQQFHPPHNKRQLTTSEGTIPLVLIQTGANYGFAGGNNVGLRYLQECCDFDYAFLLNNDALLTTGAVNYMVARFKQAPNIGMCGCTVIYNHTPTQVQALGGARYQPWIGRSQHIGAHTAAEAPREISLVESQLDYILGAALMISRPCLNKIGLMDESYFLYYEEIDWATRAKRAGFTLAYSPDAVVFHKEGGTIGSSSAGNKRSLLSEYYLVRSRVAFTRKFYPQFLLTTIAFTLAQGARALLAHDFKRFAVRLKAILGVPL